MAVYLEKCFGCLRLRTGVLIIGYLQLIVSLVSFIMHTIMVIAFFVTHKHFGGRVVFVNLMSVVQTFVLSYIFTVVLLIYGATKGNRHLMIPYISTTVISTAYVVCYELLCCLFLVSQIISLFISAVFVGVNVFVIYVIVSHHQELKIHTLHNRDDDEVSIVNSV